MTERKFKPMDFMKNKAIINEITSACVTDGRVDHFMMRMYKEVYLVCEYTEYEAIVDADGDVNLIATFTAIRNDGSYMDFVDKFDRKHLVEFEKLLDLELEQEARLQLNEKTVVNVIEDFLYNLLAKIPSEEKMMEMMKELPKSLNGIDSEKVSGILKIVEKLGKK